jgi:hypothetical protein
MKTLIKIIIVGLVLWLLVWLDSLLYSYSYIISLFSATEWIRVIKAVVVLVMIAYTSGIVLFVTMLVGIIVSAVVDGVWKGKRNSSKGWKYVGKKRLDDMVEVLIKE